MNPNVENLHNQLNDSYYEMTMNDDLANYVAKAKEHYKSHPEDARFISQFLFRCYYWCDNEKDDGQLCNQIKTFHKEILNANQIVFVESDEELRTLHNLHPWNCARYGDLLKRHCLKDVDPDFQINLKK